jgi:hypothetical protein
MEVTTDHMRCGSADRGGMEGCKHWKHRMFPDLLILIQSKSNTKAENGTAPCIILEQPWCRSPKPQVETPKLPGGKPCWTPALKLDLFPTLPAVTLFPLRSKSASSGSSVLGLGISEASQGLEVCLKW